MKKVMMVSPDNFEVTYSINPWMNVHVNVDGEKATQQWETIRKGIISEGIETEVLNSIAGLPDMVFPANAGMIYEKKAIVSKFRDKERAGEEKHFEEWFKNKGFETLSL
jgi:N-dimethylarginine dimethylaminohydrolase